MVESATMEALTDFTGFNADLDAKAAEKRKAVQTVDIRTLKDTNFILQLSWVLNYINMLHVGWPAIVLDQSKNLQRRIKREQRYVVAAESPDSETAE